MCRLWVTFISQYGKLNLCGCCLVRRKVWQAFLNASHRKKFEKHWLRTLLCMRRTRAKPSFACSILFHVLTATWVDHCVVYWQLLTQFAISQTPLILSSMGLLSFHHHHVYVLIQLSLLDAGAIFRFSRYAICFKVVISFSP